jgi:hypothetical protein
MEAEMPGGEIDLTGMSQEQLFQGMADMVMSLLQSHRAALLVSRPDGVITFLNPIILQSIPPDELASTLLESWDADQVSEFLEHVYG